MKLSLKYILFISCLCFFSCFAQQDRKVIQLWENEIPGAIENSEFKEIEIIKDAVVTSLEQVSQPTLTVFKPEQPNGIAVIICPGGGYHHLAIHKEGYKVAEWLNTLGITAFVLKYRLPNDAIMKNKSIGPLQDAQKAMRYVRSNASNWNLNKDKIGIMGFSAGGHLAAILSTQYDKKVYEDETKTSAKPDFSILIYPVISMKESITHKGSRTNLLGETPSEELLDNFSNDAQIDANTPRTFLVHATDDKSVPVENSIQYYLGLKQNNVSSEMHVYEKGGHGFGLGRNSTHPWVNTCEQWLKTIMN
ncbi:alpha/beta hydrolase [Psychroserpens sp. Hel_I_66]|uniref:alpha/beta hydrolase n=1 Tax=Psychroserpens sp. Hel_I_66 TaxID=1250004 RepID=UPI000A78EDF5|nr:alpha/beta hydrolase [Psychroserpens sp. Hel_I_66]